MSSVTVVVAESVALPAASEARATAVYCAPSVRLERSHAREAEPVGAIGEPIVVPAPNAQLVPAQ